MGQDLHNDKLFEAAKHQLSDLEVPYDAAGWEKMSRALDKQPRGAGISRRWMLNSLAALIAAGGIGWAAWNYWPSGSKTPAANTVVPEQNMVVKPAAESSPAVQNISQPVASSVVTSPASATVLADVNPVKNDATRQNGSSSRKRDQHQHTNDVLPLEMPLTGFGDADASAIPANVNPNENLVFPDQIDPVRGVMRRTNEKPDTYTGITPPDPLSLDYYDAPGKKINLNVDSSKKNKDKKDSATGPQK